MKVLDDFLFIADTPSECCRSLSSFHDLCKNIGVPIAYHKTEGPTKCLTFLGIELDTEHMITRLPANKLFNYADSIDNLLKASSCTLRSLKSILGKLQFACSVVSTGRPFLRRLYDATIGIKKPHHFVKLTADMKKDLNIWSNFLSCYNGVTIIRPRLELNSSCLLYTSPSPRDKRQSRMPSSA